MTATRVPLGELVSIVGGGTPDRGEPSYWGAGIAWATVKDLIDLRLSRTQESITPAGLQHSAASLVPAGSVIVATRMALGKAVINTIDVAINQDLKALTCGPRVDARYLLHFLVSQAPRLEHMGKGATVKGITLDRLTALAVPSPPLAEQRRIAAMLDKADAVRRKRPESLKLLDEFLRSAFLEMFGDPVRDEKGWGVVALGSIAEVQGGLQVTSTRDGHSTKVPYLRVANVYRDLLDLGEVKELGVTKGELGRTALRSGDLLIVEGHGNPEEIGRAAVWDGSIHPCVHQNHLIRLRLDGAQAEPAFVSAFLNSSAGRRQMLVFGKTTSGLNTISSSNVKHVRVMLPPIEAQRRYVQLRSGLQEGRQRMMAAEQESRTLFDSLAQRAFAQQL